MSKASDRVMDAVNPHESLPAVASPARPLSKPLLARLVRSALASHIVDDSESAADGEGYAIYFLADPRDVRAVRYVGQTRSPQRRYQQHLASARLWLPDAVPWWVKATELRALYTWMSALHSEDHRLPVMVVRDWQHSLRAARVAEREQIHALLAEGASLFNVEHERAREQLPLPLLDSANR